MEHAVNPFLEETAAINVTTTSEFVWGVIVNLIHMFTQITTLLRLDGQSVVA